MRLLPLTANADEAKARETLKTGAFDYVTKPFRLDRLSEVVGVAMTYGVGDTPPEARQAL